MTPTTGCSEGAVQAAALDASDPGDRGVPRLPGVAGRHCIVAKAAGDELQLLMQLLPVEDSGFRHVAPRIDHLGTVNDKEHIKPQVRRYTYSAAAPDDAAASSGAVPAGATDQLLDYW
jgi:hypothetical protein